MTWPAANISGCSKLTLQPVIIFGADSTAIVNIITDIHKLTHILCCVMEEGIIIKDCGISRPLGK